MATPEQQPVHEIETQPWSAFLLDRPPVRHCSELSTAFLVQL